MKQIPTNAPMHSVASLANADLSIYDSVDDQVLSDYAVSFTSGCTCVQFLRTCARQVCSPWNKYSTTCHTYIVIVIELQYDCIDLCLDQRELCF